jgi:hypothetical protein
VAERLESAVAGSLAMKLVDYEGIDLDAWHAHGRVTCHKGARSSSAPSFDALVARSQREHPRGSRVPTLLGALPLADSDDVRASS